MQCYNKSLVQCTLKWSIYLALTLWSSLTFCFSSVIVLFRRSTVLCKFLCFRWHSELQELLTLGRLGVITWCGVNMRTGAATGVSVAVTDVVAPVAVHVSWTATAVYGTATREAALVDAVAPAESLVNTTEALLQMSSGEATKSSSTAMSSAISIFLFLCSSLPLDRASRFSCLQKHQI